MKQTRCTRRLIRALLAEGINLPDPKGDWSILPLFPGPFKRLHGALSWHLIHPQQPALIGSQWSATECIKDGFGWSVKDGMVLLYPTNREFEK